MIILPIKKWLVHAPLYFLLNKATSFSRSWFSSHNSCKIESGVDSHSRLNKPMRFILSLFHTLYLVFLFLLINIIVIIIAVAEKVYTITISILFIIRVLMLSIIAVPMFTIFGIQSVMGLNPKNTKTSFNILGRDYIL